MASAQGTGLMLVPTLARTTGRWVWTVALAIAGAAIMTLQ